MNENQHFFSACWQKCRQQWYATLNAYDVFCSNPPILKAITYILAATLLWIVFPEREIHHASGILVPQEPQRTGVENNFPFVYKKKYTITPVQGYELTARLLHKHHYTFLEKDSDLVPMDMLLGWSVMSDSRILDHMSFSIMSRTYYSHYDSETPLSGREMEPYMDNNHLIPATDAVEKAFGTARVGDLIHIKGFLVNATWGSGYHWNTSLARGSTADTINSCKLIYVEEMDIENRPR